ncbi:hypothetical protein OHA72_58385 [Dactylosporangium sp. NBC_01737]|uniref:hypothetical protein n=1 Tax=Dactylosporangium sp. NBC_01737 TaxID=2975959 RepID=UPI002E0FE6BB|nr:hypothetical protein OHA72_58385 [Dactylosporangium sp. NBC_01737]
MTDVVIDLDTPVPARPPVARRHGLTRGATVAVFALLAAAPATAPVPVAAAQRLPVPSYCSGDPMPGGRLNIVEGDVYVILDGPTRVVISTGRCPHRR